MSISVHTVQYKYRLVHAGLATAGYEDFPFSRGISFGRLFLFGYPYAARAYHIQGREPTPTF